MAQAGDHRSNLIKVVTESNAVYGHEKGVRPDHLTPPPNVDRFGGGEKQW